MAGDRSRYGLSVSALGAIVLAVSVFLPWYGVRLTQQTGVEVVSHRLTWLSHQRLALVSGEHALRDLSIVLLVLAGLAILDALVPLARTSAPLPGGAGGSVVLLGALASACVVYRMIDPPAALGEQLLLRSLREGAWLALLGSLAIALGGMWPRFRNLEGAPVPDGPRALSWQ